MVICRPASHSQNRAQHHLITQGTITRFPHIKFRVSQIVVLVWGLLQKFSHLLSISFSVASIICYYISMCRKLCYLWSVCIIDIDVLRVDHVLMVPLAKTMVTAIHVCTPGYTGTICQTSEWLHYVWCMMDSY